jgi:hypothetical protein
MPTFPKPLRPAEALRKSGTAIDVADGETVAVGYFSESYPEIYRIAEVAGIEDLQTLGLIPQDLSEQELIEAVAADDASFQEQAPQAHKADTACCSDCASETSATKRRWFQANLARVVSKSYKRRLAVTGPEVLSIHHQVGRVLNTHGVLLVGIANPNDITIGAGSTLLMAPTVHLLNADVITIKANGVLRFESANVHVRCNELTGPYNPPLIIPDLDIPQYILPDELTVGGLLAQLPAGATSDTDVLAAHKHLPGFDTEYLLAHNAFQS